MLIDLYDGECRLGLGALDVGDCRAYEARRGGWIRYCSSCCSRAKAADLLEAVRQV